MRKIKIIYEKYDIDESCEMNNKNDWKNRENAADKNNKGANSKVKQHYARVAREVLSNFSDEDTVGHSSCCEPPASASEARFLYAQDILSALPGGARAASRGCGDPVARAGLQPGERVLDLGCGGGIDALIASRLVGARGRVFGIDMTPEMVKLARENADQAGSENIDFLQGNIEDLPLASESLDVVLSNCVINFSENKQQVMNEACRVLAPGGRFVISDIVQYTPISEKSYAPLCKIVGTTNGMSSARKYEQMLKVAGFDYVSIEPKTTYTLDVLKNKAKQKERMEYFEEISGDAQVSGASGSVIIIAEKVGDISKVPDEPIGARGVGAPTAEETTRICEIAKSGHTPAPEDLAKLLEIEPGTPQDEILNVTANELVRRGNGGLGYVYAQIGLDAGPCAGNCHFCNFAACNFKNLHVEDSERSQSDCAALRGFRLTVPSSAPPPSKPTQPDCDRSSSDINTYKHNPCQSLSIDDIAHFCRLFAENGVHLISLMASASYPHKAYVKAIQVARESCGSGVYIMANASDLTLEEAKDIKAAGADCIYHAVRLGEGVITDIPEDVRWNTLENALQAGLEISTAVEPLYQSQDLELGGKAVAGKISAEAVASSPTQIYTQTKRQIIERMLQILRYDLFCTGCVNLNAVRGTKMQDVKPWPASKMRIIANTLHIAAHGRVKHGGCCSIQWVDAGGDPRDRGYKETDEALIKQITRARNELLKNNWTLAPTPTDPL